MEGRRRLLRARANALEDNVSLYYTQNGRRNTIKYVNAPVAKNQWHTLKVEFTDKSIRVTFDGKVAPLSQVDVSAVCMGH